MAVMLDSFSSANSACSLRSHAQPAEDLSLPCPQRSADGLPPGQLLDLSERARPRARARVFMYTINRHPPRPWQPSPDIPHSCRRPRKQLFAFH
eukprot:9367486-Pyramimonas_sp.AAC.1